MMMATAINAPKNPPFNKAKIQDSAFASNGGRGSSIMVISGVPAAKKNRQSLYF